MDNTNVPRHEETQLEGVYRRLTSLSRLFDSVMEEEEGIIDMIFESNIEVEDSLDIIKFSSLIRISREAATDSMKSFEVYRGALYSDTLFKKTCSVGKVTTAVCSCDNCIEYRILASNSTLNYQDSKSLLMET